MPWFIRLQISITINSNFFLCLLVNSIDNKELMIQATLPIFLDYFNWKKAVFVSILPSNFIIFAACYSLSWMFGFLFSCSISSISKVGASWCLTILYRTYIPSFWYNWSLLKSSISFICSLSKLFQIYWSIEASLMTLKDSSRSLCL